MADLEKDVVTAEVEAEAKPKRATKKAAAEKAEGAEKEAKATKTKATKTTKAEKADTTEKAVKTTKAKTTTKKATAEKAEKAEKAPAKKTTKKTAVAKDKTIQYLGTGRRKKSIARVRLIPGEGKFVVNKRKIEEYFPLATLIQVSKQPLTLVDLEKKFDVYVNVSGGGLTGQAGAIRLGVARAIVKFDENYKAEIKKAGFLTRDARAKERKKYGLHKARKAPQFSKR